MVLPSQQRLVVTEQYLINFEDVIFTSCDEVFDYHIKLLTMGESVAGSFQKVVGFVESQLQRHGQSNGSTLAGPISLVASYFGKQLAINVGTLIYLHIGLAFGVNQTQ